MPLARTCDRADVGRHPEKMRCPSASRTEVRDANGWSHHLNEALARFGSDAQLMIAQHHWPVWGNDRIVSRLQIQRDLYKYIHDQSVRMMNQGYGPAEIAEALNMPPGLENERSAVRFSITLKPSTRNIWAGTMATRRR